MKHFGPIVLAIVVVVGLIVGVFYYFNGYTKPKSSVTLTTAATVETTEDSSKTLLAENEEGDFKLYKQGSKILLVHNGKTNEFTGWSRFINYEKPKMYYEDFDNDDEKELLIKVVSNYNVYGGDNEYCYDLYILKPEKQENGDYKYNLTLANRDAWRQPFEQYINCAVSQLKKDKSRLQVVMDNSEKSISYDTETGITTSKYVGFARADKEKDGSYKTLTKWDKGNGNYVVDGNSISVDIDIRAFYGEETTSTVIGTIHCGLIIDGGRLNIKPNSVYFEAGKNRSVTDPRDTSSEDWSYTLKNIASSSTNDKNINWIDAELSIPSSGSGEEKSFVSMDSEMKSLESVQVTNRKIVLTAKDGYSFVNGNVVSGYYSVNITLDDEDYDIAYSAEITKEGSKNVLTITLDKSYKRSDLKNISIKFGA